MGLAGRHGRSCPRMRFGATTGWSGGISRRRFVQLIQGLHGELRGKPYAGNPHVRFDEALLARACLRRAGAYSTRSADSLRNLTGIEIKGLVLFARLRYAAARCCRDCRAMRRRGSIA